MRIQIQLPLEHGVMFISDPHESVTIPEDTGASRVTYTNDCVAFHVTPYVDGEADVVMSNLPPPRESLAIHHGNLFCSSGILTLTDSYAFSYCSVPVAIGNPEVKLFAYGAHNEQIWVEINSIQEY